MMHNLTPEEHDLIAKNTKLVHFLIRRYAIAKNETEFEECYSAGLWGIN